MLKLYKWLVYIIMRPYKKFQHLIKCLAIYFSTARQMSEKKNRKRRRKAYLAPRREQPIQPTRPRGAAGSSSPPRASKLLGGMPPSQPWTPRRRREPSRPPRAF